MGEGREGGNANAYLFLVKQVSHKGTPCHLPAVVTMANDELERVAGYFEGYAAA